MAAPANTVDLIDVGRGARENLSDVIYNLYPTEAVLQSNFGLRMSDSRYIEWQTDTLRDPAVNAHFDGEIFQNFTGATKEPVRYGNYHQISGYGFNITRRAIIADKAGRSDEMAYHVIKGLRELRNDVEWSAGRRQAARPGNATTDTPLTAGVPVWITSQLLAGTSGTVPTRTGALGTAGGTTDGGYPSGIGNPGTARGFTEGHLRKASLDTYKDANEMPNMFVMPPEIKQSFSEFMFTNSSRRIAEPQQDFGKDPGMGVTVIGAVDVYADDFGKIALVPSRFVPAGDGSDFDGADSARSCELMLLNPEYWEFSHFSPFHVSDIGKDGDSERRMILVDWSICAKHEGSSALVTAINVGTAVSA